QVGQHRVELVRHAGQQVGVQPAHLEPQALRVRASHVEGVRADLAACHAQVGSLVLQGQRYRAAAAADVEHASTVAESQCSLHEQLGLGARDQHARVDSQLKSAKSLAPDDVRDGLALHGAAAHGV